MVARTGIKKNPTGIPFKKTVLALSVMAVANAHAQTENGSNAATQTNAPEEVVVTGIRQNIINAQAMKRNAETFVDAISAEDIGSLPDASVLEALQRVPGVAIERFAAPNDSDHFSSEGSNITLRGLPQTRTSFNGRDSFSANSGRGLSFEDVSKELLGSVEVVKNQTADMVEGGISGTVTLNTRKPFDSNGRQLSFSAQANYGDFRGEVTPSFSGLYSDIFELGGGELGFLVSYSESRLKFRADGTELGLHNLVTVQDENGADQEVYAPINAGIRSTDTDRFRRGLATSLQYRTDDSRFESTLEYVRSQSSSVWRERAFFSDDQGGSSYTDAVFNNGVFESGIINANQNGFGPQTRESDSRDLVEDVSLNLQFQATDRLRLSFDAQFIQAETNVEDLSVFGALQDGLEIKANANGGNPSVEFLAPASSSQTSEEYFADPTNYFFRAAMDHLEDSDAEQKAFQFDLDYDIDNGVFRSLEAGVRFAERDQITRWSTYNWKNLSESWNGGQIDFAGNLYDNVSDNSAINGNISTGTVIDSLNTPAVQAVSIHPGIDFTALYIDPTVVSSFTNFRNLTTAPFARRSGPPLDGREGVVDGFYLPGEVNPTVEQNQAAYVKLNFGGGDTNRFSGNIGLRYVNQTTTTTGNVTYPQEDLANNQVFSDSIPANALAVINRAPEEVVEFESDFSTVLPSLNIKYELTDDLIVRAAFSQSVSFPNLGDLRFNYNINTIRNGDDFAGFTQISGNPNLEPMEADNYDLSLEWYFDDDSSLTVGAFYKDIVNFFANGTTLIPLVGEGLPTGADTQFVSAQQPINTGEGTLSGLEIGYSHFFKNLPDALDGFGVQMNYSFIESDGVPNQNTNPTEFGSEDNLGDIREPFTDLPLQGLSEHTFNFVAIYDTDVISSRLAFNYRSDYLLSISQVNLRQPVYAESTLTLDGSAFYNVSETIRIGVTGTNLTNEQTRSRLQVDQAGTQVTRSSFVNDRRYSLVFQVNL